MKQILRATILVFVASVAACADPNARPPNSSLRVATAIERQASLSLLRHTWEQRPRGLTDDNFWHERRFLDRSAFFGRKIRNTETYVEACNFWMRCVREHVDRYDDTRYR